MESAIGGGVDSHHIVGELAMVDDTPAFGERCSCRDLPERGEGTGPEQDRRLKDNQAIDESSIDEASGEPCPTLHEQVLDSGAAVCWKSDTGEERWREKVDKDFYASPVMVGNRIYVTNLRGVTSVFEATPAHFKLLAQNQLGQEALASPAICSDRIYLRHATTGESRQEYLWCIGQAAEPRKTALLGP